MAFTVTATEGGSTANGITLSLKVITGQSPAQPGTIAQATQTTNSLNVTPAATGSWVYASLLALSSAGYTALTGTTIERNDSGGGLQFLSLRTTGTTTAATPLTIGTNQAANGISIVACEIQATGTLVEDATSPAGVHVAGTAATTAAFSPPAGSLLVALIQSNGGGGVTTMAVSDTSGLGLTWTEQVKQHTAGDGYSGIWTAKIPGGATPVAPQPVPPGFLSPAAIQFTYRLPYPFPTVLSASFTGTAGVSSTGFRCVAVPPPVITHGGRLPAPVVMPLSYASPAPRVPFTGYAAEAGRAASATGRDDPFTGRGAVSGVFASTRTAPGVLAGPAAEYGLAAGFDLGAGAVTAPLAVPGTAAGSKTATGAFTGPVAGSGTGQGSPPVPGTLTAALAVSGSFFGAAPARIFRVGSPWLRWETGVPFT